jgi:hypothetical protein
MCTRAESSGGILCGPTLYREKEGALVWRILMVVVLAAVALVVPISPAMAQDFQEEAEAYSVDYWDPYYIAEEIAVTGVVSEEGMKADGTPLYGIKDETTLGKEWYQQVGYLMEGDYSAYVGQRITVHGILKSGYVERVLEVTWIE